MQANSQSRDYFWNTLGVFLQNAISPLLLIVVTRINGVETSGVFSFAFALSIVFWAFAMWGGRTYQVSDVREEFVSRSYVFTRLILAVVTVIGALLFSVANNYDAIKTGVIVLLVLFKVVESIADAVYGVLQKKGYLYVSGKSLVYKAVVGFAAFLIVDILTGDILLSCMAIVVVNAVILLSYDMRLARKMEDITFSYRRLGQYAKDAVTILRRCSAVFAVIFLSMFSLNIPRYFVDVYHGQQVAYFGILAMPITLVALFMSFVLQPKIVGLSTLYERKQYVAYNRVVLRLLATTLVVGIFVLAGAFLVGAPLLRLIFGMDFSDYKISLMTVVAGGIVNALVSVFINILVIMRRFKSQFYILLATNIVLLLLSWSIIREYGLNGGFGLFVFTNVIQFGLLFWVYANLLRKKQHDLSQS